MADLLPPDPAFDWLAGALFLWLGAAGWVTAVAAHLRLSEWRWFALALVTGPVAWIAIGLRLRRHRASPKDAPPPARPTETVAGR